MSSDFDQQLINQLIGYESGLEQTAPGVFKTVFQADRQDEFLKALQSAVRSKDVEIERECAEHYRIFVKSIDELLGLRQQAAVLKEAVLTVQSELDNCGQLLYDTKMELYEGDKMLYVTARSIAALKDCLGALDLAQQALLHSADANYAQAIRLLTELATVALPRVEAIQGNVLESSRLGRFQSALKSTDSMGFSESSVLNSSRHSMSASSMLQRKSPMADGSSPFEEQEQGAGGIQQPPLALRLRQWLPVELKRVRECALSEAKHWLEGIRRQHIVIGERAFERAQRRIERKREMQLASDRSDVDLTALATAQLDVAEMERSDAALGAQIDFEPLLRALNLFELMDRRGEFETLFAEYRRLQANVILEMDIVLQEDETAMESASMASATSGAENARDYASFLHRLAGFFIVEFFLVQKPQQFYSPAHVEMLWDDAVAVINRYVMGSLGGAGPMDQAVCMKIKWLQVFFLHAMEIYSMFNVSSMMETILSLFYRYLDLAQNDAVRKLQDGSALAVLAPLPIANAQAVVRMKKMFSMVESDPDIDLANAFVFSQFVVDVYMQVGSFVSNYYQFLEGVPEQTSEMDDVVRKNVDLIISEAVSAYAERVQGAAMEGVVQLLRDLDALMQICTVDVVRMLVQRRQAAKLPPLAGAHAMPGDEDLSEEQRQQLMLGSSVRSKSQNAIVILMTDSVRMIERSIASIQSGLFAMINARIDGIMEKSPFDFGHRTGDAIPRMFLLLMLSDRLTNRPRFVVHSMTREHHVFCKSY